MRYSFNIIQKEFGFLAVITTIKWTTKSRIGPFIVERIHWPDGYNEDPITITYKFTPTEINMTFINFGISAGLRFGW